jgi:hypothetical protein
MYTRPLDLENLLAEGRARGIPYQQHLKTRERKKLHSAGLEPATLGSEVGFFS